MMKDVEFSCIQKVMISSELIVKSASCSQTFSGGKYFLAANFQVAQRHITQYF